MKESIALALKDLELAKELGEEEYKKTLVFHLECLFKDGQIYELKRLIKK